MEVKLESKHVNYVETSTFVFLFEDNQFTDVTLVCEDMQQTRVHKLVLSYVSELLQEIFPRNSHTQVEGLTASAQSVSGSHPLKITQLWSVRSQCTLHIV